jgi:hypothetical protein
MVCNPARHIQTNAECELGAERYINVASKIVDVWTHTKGNDIARTKLNGDVVFRPGGLKVP